MPAKEQHLADLYLLLAHLLICGFEKERSYVCSYQEGDILVEDWDCKDFPMFLVAFIKQFVGTLMHWRC